MARDPTTFSRLSTGYKSSANTIAESNYDFSCIDGYCETMVSNAGFTGDLTGDVTGDLTGAVTGTTGTFSSSLAVGGGTTMEKISCTTHSLDFSVAAWGSSILTVGIAGATGDDILLVTPPSTFSTEAYYLMNAQAYSGDTAGEVNVVLSNSGATDVDVAAGVFSILRIAF